MKYEKHGDEKHADMTLYACARDVDLTPGIRYGPVIRDTYIIECCTGGYGSVIINGTEYAIKGGDCIILLPGDVIIHTADNVEPRHGVWCSIKGILISSYLAALGITSTTPYAPKEAFDSIVREIENMLSMKNDNDAGADLRRQGCMNAMFGEMMRYANLPTDSSIYIQKAFHIMEMRYAENLKVSDIATELGLERCYFTTLFKRITGKTPHSYLNELRIKKSCTLLLNGYLSVSEASRAVGIDPVGFARIFKKYTGSLPGEYIKLKSAAT